MTQKALFEAIQEQNRRLLNVLSIVQCMGAAIRSSRAPDLQGTVELLEEEVQRILEGLDEFTLEPVLAAPEQATAEEAQP